MGFEASKLVCISLVFPENSPAGRDYVADIASEVGFNREESDRYTWIKGSFFGFFVGVHVSGPLTRAFPKMTHVNR